MLLSSPRSLYAAFDRFPTRKGASTHIARFAPCLFDYCGGGLLYALGDDSLPAQQLETDAVGGPVEILRFCAPVTNFLERAMAFGDYLDRVLDAAPDLQICHFRDPWSGVPILSRQHEYATVFEVNALPSIELPHAFPGLAVRTLEKIRAAESFCLEACDRIVTPSFTTRDLLLKLGVPAHKISVVPNGADLIPPQARPPDAPANYLLYFGALQSWQGVDQLLRAFARLADLDLHLVVCGSARSREARRCERFAERLGLGERVVWRWALPAAELRPWLSNALLTVAPLRECARNVQQGCAPLKILESLGAGVAVVASNLAPVREIITDGVEGRLVAPDRPAELARAIRILHAYPQIRDGMAQAGRARIAEHFSWERSLAGLRSVYASLRPELRDPAAAVPAALLSQL